MRDRAGWLEATALGLAFAGLAMSMSLYLPLLWGSRGWIVPRDIWMEIDAGRFVWHGALGYVYSGTHSYAPPLSFVLAAPVSALVDHYRLIEGAPFPIGRPSAWLVVGPYCLIFGVFLLQAVHRVAWQLGVRTRLWALQLCACVVVLLPSAELGHFEDVLALTFLLHCLHWMLKGRMRRAALLLGFAILSKQWALLALPVLVVASPVAERKKVAATALALPAVVAAYMLSVDWSDAARALAAPVVLTPGVAGHYSPLLSLVGAKVSDSMRELATALSVACAWLLRSFSSPLFYPAVVALVLAIRPALEPISYGYYWGPSLVLAGLACAAVHRRFRFGDWVYPLLIGVWSLPAGYMTSNAWWWTGQLFLLAVLAVHVFVTCRREFPISRFFKTYTGTPINTAMTSSTSAGDHQWIP